MQRERLLQWIEDTARIQQRKHGAAKVLRKPFRIAVCRAHAAISSESGINPVTIGRNWKRQSLPGLQEVFELET